MGSRNDQQLEDTKCQKDICTFWNAAMALTTPGAPNTWKNECNNIKTGKAQIIRAKDCLSKKDANETSASTCFVDGEWSRDR